MPHRAITVGVLAVLCASVVPAAAPAATIDVTVAADTVANDGECSLREAVTATNLNADVGGADDCDHDGGTGADAIVLPEPATQYSLAGPAGENGNVSGDLDITPGTGGLTIRGAGALATPIDAGDLDRVLDLSAGDGDLVLRDLALRDGQVAGSGGGVQAITSGGGGSLTLTRVNVVSNEAGSDGGGILTYVPLAVTGGSIASNKASAPVHPSGGGIAALDTTTLTRTTISGNSLTASGPGTGAGVDGGGIAQGNGGSLTVTDTSVQGNSVTASNNLDFPNGAGIAVEGANLTVTGSVVKNNSLSGGNRSSGGGVHLADNGPSGGNSATLKNTTIAGNDADSANSSGGGGLKIVRGVTELSNVTIAENTADLGKAINYQDSNQVGSVLRVRGTILSEGGSGECALPSSVVTTMGYNVDEGTSCIPADGTSLQSTDPQLGSLASNGGLTSTMALPATSEAIDLMPPAQCEDIDGNQLGVDQRGVPRPFGDGCEPGAYERSTCRGALVGNGAIIGTPAADDLRGTTGDDVIVAGGGQDDVGAGAGGDRVCAGLGGDTVAGAPGDDKLSGEEGNDTLSGGKDDDNCNGGPGTDSATGCEVQQGIP